MERLGPPSVQPARRRFPAGEVAQTRGRLQCWAGQGVAPLSQHPFFRQRPLPPLRSGRFYLTEPNASQTFEEPASLRSDGARLHPGIPLGFPPELLFSFVGIPI